nr:MAG TPA: hypothetical protein [Caudoviricetes sp.]
MDRIKNAIIHWLGGCTAEEKHTVELQCDRLYADLKANEQELAKVSAELDKLKALDHDTVLDIDGKQIWVK